MEKKWFILIIAIVSLFNSYAMAQPYINAGRNLIVTEGTAEVTGQNDSALISLAVVTNGKDLEEVSTENAVKTRKVMKSIRSLDIKNLDLNTSEYNVIPQRDYKLRPPRIMGYEVHNSIIVKLEKFEPEKLSVIVSRIIGLSLESGANNIQSVQLYIKDKNIYEKQALNSAVKEAMERAETLAKAAGVKIERIVSITTQPIDNPQKPLMLRSAGPIMETDVSSPPIEIGESTVRVVVNMVFEID